jgi:hypothetical protein
MRRLLPTKQKRGPSAQNDGAYRSDDKHDAHADRAFAISGICVFSVGEPSGFDCDIKSDRRQNKHNSDFHRHFPAFGLALDRHSCKPALSRVLAKARCVYHSAANDFEGRFTTKSDLALLRQKVLANGPTKIRCGGNSNVKSTSLAVAIVGAPHSPSKTGVNALVVGARNQGGHKGRPYGWRCWDIQILSDL